MKDPTIAEQLQRQGFDRRVSPRQDFADRLRSDYELWGKAVRQAKTDKLLLTQIAPMMDGTGQAVPLLQDLVDVYRFKTLLTSTSGNTNRV